MSSIPGWENPINIPLTSTLQNIADAIRYKMDINIRIKPEEMGSVINSFVNKNVSLEPTLQINKYDANIIGDFTNHGQYTENNGFYYPAYYDPDNAVERVVYDVDYCCNSHFLSPDFTKTNCYHYFESQELTPEYISNVDYLYISAFNVTELFYNSNFPYEKTPIRFQGADINGLFSNIYLPSNSHIDLNTGDLRVGAFEFSFNNFLNNSTFSSPLYITINNYHTSTFGGNWFFDSFCRNLKSSDLDPIIYFNFDLLEKTQRYFTFSYAFAGSSITDNSLNNFMSWLLSYPSGWADDGNCNRIINLDSAFEDCYKLNHFNYFDPINTQLGYGHFNNMFRNCYNLLTGPSVFNCRSWGEIFYNSLFENCYNLNMPSINFTNGNNFPNVFRNCQKFNGIVTLENSDKQSFILDDMFKDCWSFNQPLIISNTRAGLSLINTFENCYNFNQTFSYLTSSKTAPSLNNTFRNCRNFNQEIQLVITNSDNTFRDCHSFNSNIIYDVSLYTPSFSGNCQNFFRDCWNFNYNISYLSSNRYGNHANFFENCYNLNQPFNLSILTHNVAGMFLNCYNLNQPFNFTIPSTVSYTWGLPRNAHFAFGYCSNLNQPISIEQSGINDMSQMFSHCNNFNQPIYLSIRNLGMNKVKNYLNISYMLEYCDNFAQAIYINMNDPYIRDFAWVESTGLFYNCNNQLQKSIYAPSFEEYMYDQEHRENINDTLVGSPITWTKFANNHGYYNQSYNIYLYTKIL